MNGKENGNYLKGLYRDYHKDPKVRQAVESQISCPITFYLIAHIAVPT